MVAMKKRNVDAGLAFLIRHLFFLFLLFEHFIAPGEPCLQTSEVPDTTLTTASTSSSVTTTTTATTTTTGTTTTTIVTCPTSAPLFTNNVADPGPGHTMLQFVPSATDTLSSPVGAIVGVDCLSGDPSVTGTSYVVRFDGSTTVDIQDIDDYPDPNGGPFEQIILTCTSTGEWDVSIVTPTGLKSGIVSTPDAIECIADPGQ